ncbi:MULTISPECIES: acyl-CoA carboxylase epsilon subunit [unclassified Streptomyces]|uniref:acyl-CoA carboxylase epsilon subunit n=1 Tax=unclassified Streptomyces TaxID=2593676 RepID=UPI00380CD0B2
MIKVVRGNPTAEELAAAVAVVQARAVAAAAVEPGGPARGNEWSDPASTVPARARMPHPGPRAWRTSYWPH